MLHYSLYSELDMVRTVRDIHGKCLYVVKELEESMERAVDFSLIVHKNIDELFTKSVLLLFDEDLSDILIHVAVKQKFNEIVFRIRKSDDHKLIMLKLALEDQFSVELRFEVLSNARIPICTQTNSSILSYKINLDGISTFKPDQKHVHLISDEPYPYKVIQSYMSQKHVRPLVENITFDTLIFNSRFVVSRTVPTARSTQDLAWSKMWMSYPSKFDNDRTKLAFDILLSIIDLILEPEQRLMKVTFYPKIELIREIKIVKKLWKFLLLFIMKFVLVLIKPLQKQN